ncbi:MAG: formimidoylglutamate deiminase [Gemmatimonadetes bacterium]|nr:formimidoylglutamate deiminase [Gemmatimonadota bacterium]
MRDHLASRALLPDGWADDVLLRVDDRGLLLEARAGATAPEARRIPGVAVPGVPNLHSHAFQRALAGLTERTPSGGGGRDTFWSWRERMYAFLSRLGPEDVEAVATQLYVELLRSGYTVVGEFHYLHHAPDGHPYGDPAEMSRRILAASRAAGIGLTHLPVLYMAGDFGGAPPGEAQRRFLLDVDGVLDLVARCEAETANDPARRVGLALHSLRAVPPEAIEPAVAGLPGPSAPVHIHVAEQRREVEACLAWSGARPVEWLLDHADVDGRWCAVHATHVEAGEAARLAATGAVAGLCPTTEANLGDGIFPLRPWLEAGGRFGVGSDSHVSTSPVEELRWLEYAQRLRLEERNVAAGFPHPSTARSLLERAWAGGAAALGLPVGRLAAGHRADWVALDPDHPALVGRRDDDLLDAWIFSGAANPVAEVVVGGRVRVEAGRHVDEDAVADRYRSVARRLVEG